MFFSPALELKTYSFFFVWLSSPYYWKWQLLKGVKKQNRVHWYWKFTALDASNHTRWSLSNINVHILVHCKGRGVGIPSPSHRSKTPMPFQGQWQATISEYPCKKCTSAQSQTHGSVIEITFTGGKWNASDISPSILHLCNAHRQLLVDPKPSRHTCIGWIYETAHRYITWSLPGDFVYFTSIIYWIVQVCFGIF